MNRNEQEKDLNRLMAIQMASSTSNKNVKTRETDLGRLMPDYIASLISSKDTNKKIVKNKGHK